LSNERAFGSYSFDDLRQSGPRYALILTVASWCTSCKAAADDLGDRGHEVVDAGGQVIELMIDGPQVGQDATQSDLDLWITTYDLRVNTVAFTDDGGLGRTTFPAREYAYIVDLDAMEVLWQQSGLYSTPTIAVIGIEKILADYLN
jgi:hypothetical protein